MSTTASLSANFRVTADFDLRWHYHEDVKVARRGGMANNMRTATLATDYYTVHVALLGPSCHSQTSKGLNVVPANTSVSESPAAKLYLRHGWSMLIQNMSRTVINV